MCIQDSVSSGLRAHISASVIHPFQQNLIQMNYFQGADPSCRPKNMQASEVTADVVLKKAIHIPRYLNNVRKILE